MPCSAQSKGAPHVLAAPSSSLTAAAVATAALATAALATTTLAPGGDEVRADIDDEIREEIDEKTCKEEACKEEILEEETGEEEIFEEEILEEEIAAGGGRFSRALSTGHHPAPCEPMPCRGPEPTVSPRSAFLCIMPLLLQHTRMSKDNGCA